jgi:hypothetical protein
MSAELAEVTVKKYEASRPFFLALERSRLPPMSKKQDLSKFDNKLRPIIDAFFSGEFMVKWQCCDISEVPLKGVLKLEGYHPNNDSMPVITWMIKFFDCKYGGFECSPKLDPKYQLIMTEQQQVMLELVFVVRFLRELGVQLMDHLPELILLSTIANLAMRLHAMKLYKDSFQLRLLCADISLGVGSSLKNGAITKVGDALETNKKYVDAANIYIELCKDDVYEGDGTGEHPLSKALLHSHAATAFKRGLDYVSSEWQAIQSLKEDCSWKWTEPPSHSDGECNSLVNMMHMYQAAREAFFNGLFTDESHERMKNVSFVLTGLLAWADFLNEDYPLFGVEETQLMVKPRFRQKKRAADALQHAFMAPNAKVYHDRILQCRGNLTHQIFRERGVDKSAQSQANFVKNQKSVSKGMARMEMKKHNGTGFNYWKCGECGIRKIDKDMKQCPCKTECYCSKECQVKHWHSAHKRTCLWKREQKKSK